MQPIKEDPEKRKAYYKALAKATFRQHFKPWFLRLFFLKYYCCI
jgi:hypothetical protein